MANYDWMDPNLTPIGGAQGAAALGNPWLTAIGLLGQTGAGLLKGTQQEWMAAPGAVAANAARNIQAGDLNKDHMANLNSLVQAIQNPQAKGAKLVQKPDGTISYELQSEVAQPQPIAQPTRPVPQSLIPFTQQAEQAPMGNNLAREGAGALGNSPFLQALWQRQQ
jgi:hypothetical protein